MRTLQATRHTFLVLGILIICFSLFADRPGRGQTTARKDQYTVSRGGTRSGAENRRRMDRTSSRNYVLNPHVYRKPSAQYSVASGYAVPYTDYEYGRILLAASGQPVEPVTISPEKSLTSRIPSDINGIIEARIVDVLDRGVMITDTREELRLRGVRVPSDRTGDEVSRYYAREAMRYLRQLTQADPVYIMVGDPLRDKDGTLVGFVYLPDGTEVNRLLLDMGLGSFYKGDFEEDALLDEMAAAEKTARDARKGIWSRKMN